MIPLMVIAGSDSSGGAGLTRDVATAGELGFQVKPVLTSVTAQTDQSFLKNHQIPSDIVQAQITAAMTDTALGAIKIGMLGTTEIAKTVMECLDASDIPVILDPVLKSSSGGSLFSGGDICDLFPITMLVTPNLDEAAQLTNRPKAVNEADIKLQAALLMQRGASAVLIKGGHANGVDCIDHFFNAKGHTLLTAPRLEQQKRGTGCTLSTAIACYIAAGYSLENACQMAKQYVGEWLRGHLEK